jgi:hypothetical protein
VKTQLFTSYVRSLMIYYFTSLLAARLVTCKEIQDYENYLKRRILGLPNDIKSSAINNVTGWYDKTTIDIIVNLSKRA